MQRDRDNPRARTILAAADDLVTTDHVLIETWLLLNSRFQRQNAESFWEGLRTSGVGLELITIADLETAWAIGETFPDQDFSIIDRTSFAMMERTGIVRAASFDSDFAVYRYGRTRDKAFTIVR